MKKRLLKIMLGIVTLSFLVILGGCDLLFGTNLEAPYIDISWTLQDTTISWSKVSGAREYIVYWGQFGGSSDPSTFTKLRTTSSTSYKDVTADKRYYAVKASGTKGESDFSNVVWSWN
jgi:hypothetical protein